MPKIHLPAGEPAGRIACNECGNKTDFVEVAENVLVTTRYVQNKDGSFTPVENDTEIHGQVRLLCGKCGEDLSRYHAHFLGMTF